MLIVLDTTALMSDPTCSSTAWRVLAHAPNDWNVRVAVPEVVVIEAVAGFKRHVDEARDELAKWASRHVGRLGLSAAGEVASAALTDAANNYAQRLRESLDDLGTTLTPPPGVRHKELVQRSANRVRPCDMKGDGYRDTLNWYTVLELARDNPDDTVAWISDNIKDFSNDTQSELHEDLIAELEAIGARDRVSWFRTLADVVVQLATEHISASQMDLKKVHSKLSEQNIKTYIRDTLIPTAVGENMDARRCALSPDATVALLAAVQQVTNIQGNFQLPVAAGEAVADFTCIAEAVVVLRMPPGSNIDQSGGSLLDSDDQGSTVQVSKSLVINGFLTLNQYGRPIDGEITSVAATKDDPGRAAWTRRDSGDRLSGLLSTKYGSREYQGFLQKLVDMQMPMSQSTLAELSQQLKTPRFQSFIDEVTKAQRKNPSFLPLAQQFQEPSFLAAMQRLAQQIQEKQDFGGPEADSDAPTPEPTEGTDSLEGDSDENGGR